MCSSSVVRLLSRKMSARTDFFFFKSKSKTVIEFCDSVKALRENKKL